MEYKTITTAEEVKTASLPFNVKIECKDNASVYEHVDAYFFNTRYGNEPFTSEKIRKEKIEARDRFLEECEELGFDDDEIMVAQYLMDDWGEPQDIALLKVKKYPPQIFDGSFRDLAAEECCAWMETLHEIQDKYKCRYITFDSDMWLRDAQCEQKIVRLDYTRLDKSEPTAHIICNLWNYIRNC